MRSAITAVVALVALLAASAPALAQDQDQAIASAKTIVGLLAKRQYQQLWNDRTSQFFKGKVTEQAFLANMTMGRNQLGSLKRSDLVDVAFSTSDPQSGFKGRIYAVTFKNAYSAGNFYERVVVVREPDGQFRMSGIWGTPAQ